MYLVNKDVMMMIKTWVSEMSTYPGFVLGVVVRIPGFVVETGKLG